MKVTTNIITLSKVYSSKIFFGKHAEIFKVNEQNNGVRQGFRIGKTSLQLSKHIFVP